MNYSFLQGYWDAARSSHCFWGECGYVGHRLVVVTLEWPPKGVRQASDAANIRHFVFDFGSGSSIRSADTPVRSLSYEPSNEPNSGGPSVFLGEVLSDGVRIKPWEDPGNDKRGILAVRVRQAFWHQSALWTVAGPGKTREGMVENLEMK